MTHPDGTYADPRALDTPLPETARVSIERPTWGEIGAAYLIGTAIVVCTWTGVFFG